MLTVMIALLAFGAGQSLEIPVGFDREVHLLGSPGRWGGDHSIRASASFAAELVANGTAEDIGLAVSILDAVMDAQETRPGALRYGNFLWTLESPAVEDLNAVEFTLRPLIPMMIRYGDRLPAATRNRVLESIRLGLDEIRKMDVHITYTNVAAMDCLNSCLGGELLNDPEIAGRGYAKLKRFTDLVAANGTPFEFNSPNYTRDVTLDAMHRLASNVRNEEARIRAQSFIARLALSVALHIHHGTGYWAGPHSRATFNTAACLGGPEVELINGLIAEGVLPKWLEVVLNDTRLPRQVDETPLAQWDLTTTIYHTADFAMSLTTREISRQTDPFYIHHKLPGSARPGVVYTRYLVDDEWFGDPERPSEQETRGPFYDEGKFTGVQSGPRAICVYASRKLVHVSSLAPAGTDRFRSAKAAVVWTQRPFIREIWIGRQRIETLPADVPPGEVVVVGAGNLLVAVRPFTISDLGCGAPIRLAEKDDELVLEMYNYLGPEKRYWEMETTSRFYQGEPQCAFYVEAAERAAYADGGAFAKVVAGGRFTDESAPAHTTYMPETTPDRPWVLAYSREGKELGVEVNLMDWKLKRRWTEQGALGWPMLESAVARQNDDGRVQVGDAVLTCGKAPAWLYANPEAGLYVAGYHGKPARLTLKTPDGRVDIKSMGIGTVVWDRGKVEVEAMALTREPKVRHVTLRDGSGQRRARYVK